MDKDHDYEFEYSEGRCSQCGEYSDSLIDGYCPDCYQQYMVDTDISGSDD